MLIDAALEEYCDSLQQEGKSPQTIFIYRWNLERMINWLDSQGYCHLADINRRIIRKWGASLWSRWQAATVKTAVCAARSFLRWAESEGLCPPGLFEALEVPTIPRKIQRTLTAEEVLAIMRACDTSTPKGRRDLAIVCMLTDPGLRAGELCRLRLADLSLAQREAVITVKGGRQEMAYFGHYTTACLTTWLADRDEIAGPGVDTVFVSIGGTTPGQPLTTRGLRIVVKRLGERAGVRGVCPHAFRRAFATLATEAGAPSRLVQGMGRWSDIKMVEVYSRALRIKQQAQGYFPIDRLML